MGFQKNFLTQNDLQNYLNMIQATDFTYILYFKS